MEGVIAKRYAKALLGLVHQPAEIAQTAKELVEFAQGYENNLAFQRFVLEPKVGLKQKSEQVGKIAKEIGAGPLVQRFARFLVTKKRFVLLPQVATAFDGLALEKLGQARAQVVVASEMKETEAKTLTRQLSEYTKKEVTLQVEIDPSILGGAVTQIGSLVLDGSVKNRLNLIRETISRGI